MVAPEAPQASGRAPSSSHPPPPLDSTLFRCHRVLAGHSRGVTAVKWSPDGDRLATGSGDGTAKVWDPTTGAATATLAGHAEGVNDVAWSPDGCHVATASDDGTAGLWDAATGARLRALTGHTHYVFSCAFHPRAALVATASFDETVRVWCTRSGACLRTLPAHSDPVTSVSFDADGSRLVTASFDGLVRIWDSATGRCLRTLTPASPAPAPVGGAAFTPNGVLVVSASLDGRVRLWDAASGAVVKAYGGHPAGDYCSTPAMLALGGAQAPGAPAPPKRRHLVLAGADDGTVWAWDATSRAPVAVLRAGAAAARGDPASAATASGHVGPVLGVATHPRLPLIATAGGPGDCCVRLWVNDQGCGGVRVD